MQIQIVCDILEEHGYKDGKSYNFMTGNSPYFGNIKELLRWYNSLRLDKKVKYSSIINRKRYIFIYQHFVSEKDQIMESGYHAKKGEVVSTDEHKIYCLDNHKWHWEEGFQL